MKYRLSTNPELIILVEHDLFIPASDPDYQAWLAEGNEPEPAEPLPSSPDWAGLYLDLIDPDKLLPLFQKIKAVAKSDLSVNVSFTALIPTLTSTRLEPALAAAIQELAVDLIEAGEVLSAEEKALWNSATEARGFSEMVRL